MSHPVATGFVFWNACLDRHLQFIQTIKSSGGTPQIGTLLKRQATQAVWRVGYLAQCFG